LASSSGTRHSTMAERPLADFTVRQPHASRAAC
jgi:hypothetical protein